jgi:hypothetical protein
LDKALKSNEKESTTDQKELNKNEPTSKDSTIELKIDTQTSTEPIEAPTSPKQQQQQSEIAKTLNSVEDILNYKERKIPVVFKESLTNYLSTKLESNNESILLQVNKLTVDDECLFNTLNDCLPTIVSIVNIENRLNLIPLILITAVIKENKSITNHKDIHLLKHLFNLIERPNEQERLMILAGCVHFCKLVGPMCINNQLLPLCWEQINDENEERRIMIAQACSTLAPYIDSEMRSSLLFSILKQIIEEDKSDNVRLYASKSLAILINYIHDKNKYSQCIQLLDILITDHNELVYKQVQQTVMPCISLWSLDITKFPYLVMHLVEKAEFYLLKINNKRINDEGNLNNIKNAKNYMKLVQLNLQFVFAHVLIPFRSLASSTTTDDDTTERLTKLNISKLNAYFYHLQQKLNISTLKKQTDDEELKLYRLDFILDDYLSLTKRYLCLIEVDAWSSSTADLSNVFTWLNDIFIRRLIQMTAQLDANSSLVGYFVQFFADFTLLFAIDYQLIRSQLIPIFEKLLNIPQEDIAGSHEASIEKLLLNNKSCTLFKVTLPVYFVGIISTLVDIEFDNDLENISKNFTINSNEDESMSKMKLHSPNEKCLNSSLSPSSSSSIKNEMEKATNSFKNSAEKRLDFLNSYLKTLFFTLSLHQANLDGIVAIYQQMKLKSPQADYIIQMLLSTLWDGIVHTSLYVRCNTAKLFEILVNDCEEYLLSTRILPALITLANDTDKLVRCSSISPLTCIIENCNNKEILERVYTQMQSFISDPILKDEYLLQIELLKSFRRITTPVNAKFREEFILPYLAILSMQVRNIISDNDYEFKLTSLINTFQSLVPIKPCSSTSDNNNSSVNSFSLSAPPSQMFSSTLLSSSSSSSSVGTQSFKSSHQQDIQYMSILLFDTYRTLCINLSSMKNKSISNQSIKESILPGLNCLKDIFENKVSSSSDNGGVNEFCQQLDIIIKAIQKNEDDSSVNNSSKISHLPDQINSLAISTKSFLSSTVNNTDYVVGAASALMSNTVNAAQQLTQQQKTISPSNSTSSSASITTPTATNNVPQTTPTTESANFKSYVFKGISSFKDNSKDRFTNFLTTNKSNNK